MQHRLRVVKWADSRNKHSLTYKVIATKMVKGLEAERVYGARRIVRDVLRLPEPNLSRWMVEYDQGKLEKELRGSIGSKGR
jgi:hypothetical protein